ncbi:MAG: nitroreductase family protein [Bacteroidales bacterium]|nr:nitroreductase family protein [Bacteroidales bacterium]
MKTIFTFLILSIFCISANAQLLQKISLPAPDTTGGIPLMKALDDRKSTKSFDPEKTLSNEHISNILWAAYGINRKDGKRTVASSFNQQELSIYIVLKAGVFLWDSKKNILNQVLSGDHRAATGMQDYVANASMNILYVSDFTLLPKSPNDEQKALTSHIHSGFSAQNVYLYAASANLGACVRSSFDKAALASLLKLKSTQQVILTQSVGFEK